MTDKLITSCTDKLIASLEYNNKWLENEIERLRKENKQMKDELLVMFRNEKRMEEEKKQKVNTISNPVLSIPFLKIVV